MVVFAIDNAGGSVKQLYEQGWVRGHPGMVERLTWTHGGPIAPIGCGRGREGFWEDHAGGCASIATLCSKGGGRDVLCGWSCIEV